MAHAQFTLDVRTGPVTRTPGEFEILPQKGSKGVAVQAPGKGALVRDILADSSSNQKFVAKVEELVAEIVAKTGKTYSKALRSICVEHELWSEDLSSRGATAPKMKEAVIRFLKTGEKGAKSDYQQKIEETSNAMAKFLLLPVVVAITSKIPDFNPKNKAHAESFMKDYRKQHGKGPTRS